MGSEVQREACSIDAEAGIVIVEGSDGVAISFTPEAADKTADRLHGGAAKARDQRDGKRPAFDGDVSPHPAG